LDVQGPAVEDDEIHV